MSDLPKAYIPTDHEHDIYARWGSSGFFSPDKRKGKKSFSMILPPPNATGVLHLGHAEMIAIQDILARYHRMKGDRTMWLPGTDHAAIATQNVVEKQLKEEGRSRHDLGRDVFLKRVNTFVEKSKDTIRSQIRAMGASVDWSRERYTMDEGLTVAVQEAFMRMYDDGLIYRGNRIVHWCPRCTSTLADDEVEYVRTKTPFYSFTYGPVVIGTARPETKFLDNVIVVHPKDKRYAKLVGKTFDVDWIDGKVQATVIADPAANMEEGTGAMTITPAHSFTDFEIARRHDIEITQIINEEGKLTDAAGSMAGMPVEEARTKVVETLKAKGLLDHVDEDYEHHLSVCYRCGTPIQPLIKRQWFIAVDKHARGKKSLKDLATDAVKSGRIRIIPARFEKTYFHWMESLHDWNISRQIWFGHRIPAWYKERDIRVQATSPGKEWKQDPDVLDTWFSSGLWTFSTLGWPKKTRDLKAFHPTSVMETGYDILFFWVARMIMMTTYLTGDVPFKTVYLHGLVRDKHGRKMSKSLSNGIDPMEMARTYGADATRLSLVVGTAPGQDFRLYDEKIAGYRNFVNKLWNVARFALMQDGVVDAPARPKPISIADKWILHRTNAMIASTTAHIEAFRFSEAGQELYGFIWHEVADWYLEITKVEPDPSVLRYVLVTIMKLSHPFMPFVTERLWGELSDDMLMIQEWPKPVRSHVRDAAVKEFQALQQTIIRLRNIRSVYHIASSTRLTVTLSSKHGALIEKLASVSLMDHGGGIRVRTPLGLAHVDLGQSFDAKKERTRLEGEQKKTDAYCHQISQKLSNKRFVDNAPREVVKAERQKLFDAKIKSHELVEAIDALRSL